MYYVEIGIPHWIKLTAENDLPFALLLEESADNARCNITT